MTVLLYRSACLISFKPGGSNLLACSNSYFNFSCHSLFVCCTLAEIHAIDKECIVTHALFECHVGATINKLCFKDMPLFHSNRPIPNFLHIKSLVKLIQHCIIIFEFIVINWVNHNLFTIIFTIQKLFKGVNLLLLVPHFFKVKKMICNILGMANNQENKMYFFEVCKVNHHQCQPQHHVIFILPTAIVHNY